MLVFVVCIAESGLTRVGGRREERGKLLSTFRGGGGVGLEEKPPGFLCKMKYQRHLAIKKSYIAAEKLKALTN